MLRAEGRASREVERLLRDGVDPPGGDARLLHRYLVDRDESAFEAIVDRHGPPVLALCRRYLRDPADVEDAFQATFLVLVRKGRDLRDGDALSSWLYGVAYRVAVRARSGVLKRRDREGGREGVFEEPAAAGRPADDSLEVLDGELARLPEKYRAPVVLCYLRGRTHDQAAAELGWPVGTVRSRMARARSILHDRLSRRGIDAPACLAALRPDLAVPSSLVAATAAAAGRFLGASAAGLASLSPSSSDWPAVTLAQGVISTMTTPTWKLLAAAFAGLGLTAGAIAATDSGPLAPPSPEKREEPPSGLAPPRAKAEQKETPEADDMSARLSKVERKLDRLLGIMEKATLAAPAAEPEPSRKPSTPPDSSVDNVGRSIGLPPSEPVPVEARSLREIEVQLLNILRKYRIAEQYIGRRPDHLSELQAQSLLEDAVAPARVLVARLREIEAKFRDTEARVQQNTERQAREFEARRAALKARASHDAMTVKKLEQLDEMLASNSENLQQCSRDTAAVRRLIDWAKANFKDVELTLDEPAPEARPTAR